MVLVAGVLLAWLAGCCPRPPPVPVQPAALAAVYCYRTLADVTCYTAPDRGREGRLVNVYRRDPLDPAWPDLQLRRAEAGSDLPG